MLDDLCSIQILFSCSFYPSVKLAHSNCGDEDFAWSNAG
jgi:hypothetical protein